MKTKFLIADEVTHDGNGKFSVKGLYPTDEIVIFVPQGANNDLPPGMESLTCLLVVSGLDNGKHKIKGKLVDPLGNTGLDIGPIDFEIANGDGHTFPFQLKPFAVTAGSGRYTWTFRASGSECTHSFNVRLVPESV